MKLYELEVSNYKCLDNYGIPLKFNNLNVFIGENDSGKTSMFEAIQILFRELEIDKSMFFDRNKKIKIRARFNMIDKDVIKKTMTLEKWDIDNYKCISNITKHLDPDVEDFEREEVDFLEYTKKLKKYNFYEDLRDFYEECLKSIDIVIEDNYEIKEVKEKGFNYLKKDYKNGKYLIGINKINDIDPSMLKNGYGIYQNTLSFFNLGEKKLTKKAIKLLKRQDFNDFMSKNLKYFGEKCENILEEMLNNYTDKKFTFHADGPFEYLADIFGDEVEWVKGRIKIIDKDKEYWDYLEFVKSCTASILFSNDNTEDVLSKIAYMISIIINKMSITKAKWDSNTFIKIRPGENYINNFERKESIKYPYLPETNIIGNYAYFLNDGGDFLPMPKVYIFGSEVINEEIPYKIFNDLPLEDNIREVREKHRDIMLNKTKLLIQNTLEKIFNCELSKIGEEIKTLSENIKGISGKIYIKNLEEILNAIKFQIEIYTDENDQVIDITKKGQGFLRKLQIAEFFYLLEREIELKKSPNYGFPIYGKDKILLIEEPELHIHAKGQIELICKIKEKLKKKSNQVFLNTHSHYVIKGTKRISDIYVFTKDKGSGISSVDNLKQQLNSDTEIIFKLENTLGLEPTDILFLKKIIIIVEGKHDIAFIKGLLSHSKVNINYEEILFQDAKGQTNIEYFIGLGVFLKIKVLVIFDKNKRNLKKREDIIRVNKYKNRDILNSILEVNVLQEPDILNYLEPKTLEKYYNMKNGSLNFKETNSLLKNIIYEKKGSMKSKEIEFFASQLSYIKDDLKNNIIKPIQRFNIGTLR